LIPISIIKWVTDSLMSHFFFLQNTPFGNIFILLHVFSSILPVRETFLFFFIHIGIIFIKVSCTLCRSMSHVCTGFLFVIIGLQYYFLRWFYKKYIPPTPFSLLCIPGGVFKSEILTMHINKLDEMVGLLTVYWG